MIRARRLVTLLPAMLAGGILFGAAFGHASSGSGDDRAPGADADTDAGAGVVHRAPARRTADGRQTRPLPPLPPAAPTPPAPPAPPVPPVPPPGGWGQPPGPGRGGFGGRFSITTSDGKVRIEGLEGFVRQHLDAARDAIRNNPSIPPDVRDRALARLDRARAVALRRIANLRTTDLDQLGDEMEKMGDELEKAMEGLDDEMEKLGEKLGQDLARELSKNLGKGFGPKIRIERHRDRGDDGDDGDDDGGDDHGHVGVVGPDIDVNVRGGIRGLPDLRLQPGQRAQIGQLRSSYERRIADARKQLDAASERLRIALDDPRTSDADISRYVDQVSSYEAEIRKARLLTWHSARRLLDDSQRKQIEDAAARKRHR